MNKDNKVNYKYIDLILLVIFILSIIVFIVFMIMLNNLITLKSIILTTLILFIIIYFILSLFLIKRKNIKLKIIPVIISLILLVIFSFGINYLSVTTSFLREVSNIKKESSTYKLISNKKEVEIKKVGVLNNNSETVNIYLDNHYEVVYFNNIYDLRKSTKVDAIILKEENLIETDNIIKDIKIEYNELPSSEADLNKPFNILILYSNNYKDIRETEEYYKGKILNIDLNHYTFPGNSIDYNKNDLILNKRFKDLGNLGLKETINYLEQKENIKIDYYIKVNKEALLSVINSTNGITINNVKLVGDNAKVYIEDDTKLDYIIREIYVENFLSTRILETYPNILKNVNPYIISNLKEDTIKEILNAYVSYMIRTYGVVEK